METDIENLEGKYYGTRIHFKTKDNHNSSVEVWMSTGTPSSRQLVSKNNQLNKLLHKVRWDVAIEELDQLQF